MAADSEMFQVGEAEINRAEATRVVEQARALREGVHYWIFSLVFTAGEGTDDAIVLDHTHLRGATVVHCANCGARDGDTSPCPGV